MQWNEISPFVWMALAFGALIVLTVVTQSRRSKALGQRLEQVARELGWSEVKQTSFFVLAVSGLWNGYAVKVRRVPRQKSVPERVVTTMRVQVPARIEIRRRQRGFLSGRPIAMFGPPVIELPLAQQFWIQSDEITLAERLMTSSAAPMLDRTLFSRFDLFKMRGDQILIQRASEHDPDGVARIAREELELARAVAEALTLRP